MSEEVAPPVKVPMIAATSMLRPPPARVGKLTETIVLPRAIEVRKLAAGAAGMLLFLILWLVLWGPFFGYSFAGFLFSSAIGVAAGLAFVTLSPIRGESMFTYLQLNVQSRRGSWVELDGQQAKAFIGIAPLPYKASGKSRIRPGAVDVLAGTVDERGVPVSREERRKAATLAAGVEPLPPGVHEGFAPLRPLGEGSVLEEKPYRNAPTRPPAPPPQQEIPTMQTQGK